MNCTCHWQHGRIIGLCRAHEEAFRQRLRHLPLDPELDPSDQASKQVQAVRTRLRTAALPDIGDLLYDACGVPVARITHIARDHHPATHATDLGVMQAYDTGVASITITAAWRWRRSR